MVSGAAAPLPGAAGGARSPSPGAGAPSPGAGAGSPGEDAAGSGRGGAPVFIVSTGRCGSTMLSNMVRRHPDLLSLSEFWPVMSSLALRGDRLGGEAVFRRLNELPPAGRALMKNGLFIDEFLYPMGPGARYRPEEVPPILCVTLPHLTDDHERLWDELGPLVRKRGEDSLAGHYRFVFEWLARRFGKRVWIERSGASLLFVPTLARLFPDARFVHLFRDGRDTALSMQGHHFFRIRVRAARVMRLLGLDPFHPNNWVGTSPWLPAFERVRFRFFSRAFHERFRFPVEAFGRFWSGMIERGLEYLEALPPDRVLSMRFETTVESPREELRRFVEFVGEEFVNEDWLREAAAMPRSRPPARLRLAPDALARLTEACAPGQRLLGYD